MICDVPVTGTSLRAHKSLCSRESTPTPPSPSSDDEPSRNEALDSTSLSDGIQKDKLILSRGVLN